MCLLLLSDISEGENVYEKEHRRREKYTKTQRAKDEGREKDAHIKETSSIELACVRCIRVAECASTVMVNRKKREC